MESSLPTDASKGSGRHLGNEAGERTKSVSFNPLLQGQDTYKLESQDDELVMAVALARVRVLYCVFNVNPWFIDYFKSVRLRPTISAGYAHESGPIQALKKKLKIHVLVDQGNVSEVVVLRLGGRT